MFSGTKMSNLVAILLMLIESSIWLSIVGAVPVDVASGKPIFAKYTCGHFGNEDFFLLSQQYEDVRTPKVCSQANAGDYGPSKMNDQDNSTFWESAELYTIASQDSSFAFPNPEVMIELDLEQIFSVQRITIQMGDSNTPTALSIQKSTDNVTFVDWIHMVDYRYKCQSKFTVDYKTIPDNLNDVICTEGAGNTFLFSDEQGSKLEIDAMSLYPLSLKEWKMVRYLRIFFHDMQDRLTMRNFDEKFDHYSVTSLEVWAECTCNGLQTDCAFNKGSNSYECVCGFNSDGRFCEKCLPLFNQYKFEYGKTCQECECYNHTSSCYYNATVESFGLSVNKEGKSSGGGVCVDCSHNTTGINCEQCLPYFYRPIGVSKSQADVCRQCGCSDLGSDVNPLSSLLGDCLRVQNDSVLPADKVPGDCYCKAFVEGRKCGVCKPGYFNLTSLNPDGCIDCLCHAPGTVNGSLVCQGDTRGQCPCKNFTTNRQCSECRDEYYGLDAQKTEGCTPCDCDIGGSTNPVCNKTTGQCDCKANVQDLRCNVVQDGFYVPGLHMYRAVFEAWKSPYFEFLKPGYTGHGYMNLENKNDSVESTLSVPAAMTARVVLKYSTTEAVNVEITENATTGNGIHILNATTCGSTWCYKHVANVNLEVGPVLFVVKVNNTLNNEFAVDYVYAVPKDIYDASLFGASGSSVASECEFLSKHLPTKGLCKERVFSLMTDYFKESLSCDCDPVGSYNNSCDPYGGQCACKPGVTGRSCDQCQVLKYNFTDTGCSACNCAGDDKICNVVTGQCTCPANTRGRQCDQCSVNHWSWNSTTGCQTCMCDPVGSSSLQCNLTSGQCDCKPGVGGYKCPYCLPGYKNLTTIGCVECGCDMRGSLSSTCSNATGQCPCKSNVQGLWCDQCKPSTFNLAADQSQGCLDCICMGITDQCDSTSQLSQQITLPLNNSANSNGFKVVNASGGPLSYQLSSDHTVKVFVNQGQQPFFQSDQFHGNLLGLSTIRYPMTITRNTPGLYGNLTAHLIGHKNRKLIYLLGVPESSANSLDVEITFDELNWLDESTGQLLSRGEFLLTVTDVSSLMLPLWYYQGNCNVTIGPVQYVMSKKDFKTGTVKGDIEQCSCGVGYSGFSCERCAYGYKRANVSGHVYLGVCVPCECNNHTDYCDPDTGVCVNCLHNTAGDNCELCANGYYGDATKGSSGDCTACPCHQPRVVNNTCSQDENGTVSCTHCNHGYSGHLCDSCETFYWGNPEVQFNGTCQTCVCNGNTAVCNQTSGECQQCGFNTTGFNCERCIDGQFGDASKQTCQECLCDVLGTVDQSAVCNHTNGQCPCLPGVNNRTCSGCQDNYYGYSNKSIYGCQDCKCNAEGSVSLQCYENGTCPCKPASGGDKCDLCAPGLFGLPFQPCQNCSCDRTGTVDPAAPCEVITGQCRCKTGVTGRRCDQCMFMYYNFSSTGCQKCGDCQQALGSDSLKLAAVWTTMYNTTKHINALREVDSDLEVLRQQLNTTLSSLGISSERLTDLSSLMQNLTQQELFMNTTVSNFQAKVESALNRAQTLETTASVQRRRITEIQGNASQVHAEILSSERLASEMLTSYKEYTIKGTENKNLANAINAGLTVSFKSQLQQVNAHISAASATLATVSNFSAIIQNEESLASAASRRADQLMTSLQDLQSRHKAVMNLSRQVSNLAQGVSQVYNQTMQNKQYAESLFAQAVVELNITDFTLRTAQKDYSDAVALFGDILVNYMGRDTSGYKIYTTKGLPCVFPFFYKGVQYTNCTNVDNPAGYWCQITPPGEAFDWGNCIFVPIPPSVTGWQVESNETLSTLSASQSALSEVSFKVNGALFHASSLSSLSQNIESEFRKVQGLGQDAVNAIEGFKQVIKSLGESVVQAKKANDTVAQAMASIKQITVAELENSASTSKAFSDSSLFRARAKNGTAKTLLDQLNSANSSLQTSIETWDKLNADWTQTETRVNSLSDITKDGSMPAMLFNGQQNVNAANSKSLEVDKENKQLQANMTGHSQVMAVVQQLRGNVSQLQTQLSGSLITYNNSLLDMQAKVSEIINSKSDSLRATIDAKYAVLQEKLARAKQLAEKLEQPVSFRGNKSVTISNEVLVSSFNDVSLEFRAAVNSTGLLFFAQGTSSVSEFTVQLNDGKVEFVFNTGNGATQIKSQANICDECWFRVSASRYFNKGLLVVTKLATGGSASDYAEGPSTDRNMSLDGQYYLAGIPQDVPVSSGKLATMQKFTGCLHNVKYNSRPVNLWRRMKLEGYTSCCAKPTESVETKLPGASFNGFGYLRLAQESFDVSLFSHASVEFRTFSPDAALLVLGKDSVDEKYGVILEGGRVVFQYGREGAMFELKSSKAYNDGQWHKLVVAHNTTFMELSVHDIMNNSQTTVSETKATSTGSVQMFDLSSGALLYLGGSPPSFAKWNNTKSLAGCVRRLKLSTIVPTLSDRQLTAANAVSQSEVSFDGCYVEVVKGLNVQTYNSYASYNVGRTLRNFRTLELQLATQQSSGVVFYMASSQSWQSKALILSLFNGNLHLLFYDENGDLKDVLTSYDLSLADGRLHYITTDFTSSSPQLIVDGRTFISSRAFTTGLHILDDPSHVYLGGLPHGFVTDHLLPTMHSLVSGIQNVRLNGNPLDVTNVQLFTSHRHVSLTFGVPKDGVPPLPYSTTTPVITTPAPTCSPVTANPQPIRNAVRFGDMADSYILYDLAKMKWLTHLNASFVLNLDFKAYASEGTVLTMVNADLNPENYLKVFLSGGYLVVRMMTSLRVEYELLSTGRVDTGEVIQAKVLRIHDFLALYMPSGYSSNLKSSGPKSYFTANKLYLGGTASPSTSFHGCILSVLFNTNITDLSLPLESPEPVRTGVASCYSNIRNGLKFDGSAYALQRSKFVINSTNLKIDMTFTSYNDSANLLTIYSSMTSFFVIDLLKGQVRVTLGNSKSANEPYTAAYNAELTKHSICNAEPHRLTVGLGPYGLDIKVDSQPEQGYAFLPPISNAPMPLYVGGLPLGGTNIKFPITVSKKGLEGCVSRLIINGQEISTYESLVQTRYGCNA